jgi:hypothetical protein
LSPDRGGMPLSPLSHSGIRDFISATQRQVNPFIAVHYGGIERESQIPARLAAIMISVVFTNTYKSGMPVERCVMIGVDDFFSDPSWFVV